MLQNDTPLHDMEIKTENRSFYKPTKENSTAFTAFGQDGISFSDFLDIINPIQHIPLISTLYRKVTGDDIDPGSKLAGSALYGGPIALVTSLLDVIVEYNSGKDIGEHAIQITTGGDSETKVVANVKPNKALINEYEPIIPRELSTTAQLTSNITNKSLSPDFVEKRDNVNLILQSILLEKIRAEINVEEQMAPNKQVRYNHVAGAYNNAYHLTKHEKKIL